MAQEEILYNKTIHEDDERCENEYMPPRANVVLMAKFEPFLNSTKIAEEIIGNQSEKWDNYLKNRKTSGHYSSDYNFDSIPSSFSIDKVDDFPIEHVQFNPDSKISHGFIPEVSRAWFFHQKTVYFWPISNPRNVYTYYPVEEKIESIFCAPVEKDIVNDRTIMLFFFISQTSVSVSRAIIQCDDSDNEDFHINVDKQSISISPHTFTTHAYTDNGRVFLGGSDGYIYELKFKIMEEILESVSLVNISMMKILQLVPSVVSNFLSHYPLKQIIVNNDESIIYTLDTNNEISIYQIGLAYERLTRIDSLSFSSIVNHFSSVSKSGQMLFESITKIAYVPKIESSFIELIAVTNNAFRIFITSSPTNTQSQAFTSSIKYRSVHFRQPPFDFATFKSQIHCTVFLSNQNFLIFAPYRKSYAIYCLSKSIRCNNELFQEIVSIYHCDEPVSDFMDGQALLYSTIPYIIRASSCPKTQDQILLQNILPSSYLIAITNPIKCLKIVFKKPYEVVVSFLQDLNKNEENDLSFSQQFTDIELNILYYTALGILGDSKASQILLKNIWDKSFSHEVVVGRTSIYKRLILKSENYPNDSSFTLLYEDLPPLKLFKKYGVLKSIRFSFIFFTLLLHSYQYLIPIWDSRVVVSCPKTQKWITSLSLSDCKYLRVKIEELLSCIDNVLNLYKQNFTNTFLYNANLLSSESEAFDLKEDMELMENLRHMVLLTFQWLHIWSGIMVTDCFSFLKPDFFNHIQVATFGDLIFRKSYITDRLMWLYLSHISRNPSNFEFFCSQWSKDAPLYFYPQYQEIIRANNFLIDACNAQQPDLRRKFLSSALHIYNLYPKTLDLWWISKNLTKICYHPNAISLCLDSYSAWIESGFSHIKSQASFLDMVKSQISDSIFFILNKSLENYEYISKNKPSFLSDAKKYERDLEYFSNNLKQTILAVISVSCSKDLAFDIFSWVVAHEYSYLLCQSTSVFLIEYLENVNFNDVSPLDLKKAKCLFDFYEKNKNFILAAHQLYKIATSHLNLTFIGFPDHKLDLNDRSDYLHIAMVHISVCPPSDSSIKLTQEITKALESVKLQRFVLSELQHVISSNSTKLSLPENMEQFSQMTSVASKLTSNLVSEEMILRDIVLPYQLAHSYLVLIKHLGPKFADQEHLVKAWNHLLQLTLRSLSSSNPEEEKLSALKAFKDLLIEYGQIEYCFPIDKILFAFEQRLSHTSLGHLWLPELLASLSILTLDQYAHKLQSMINQLLYQNLEDNVTINVLFYVFETYNYLCSHILNDVNKLNFANDIELFNEYLNEKFSSINIRNRDLISLKDKVEKNRNILLQFFDNVSKTTSHV